MTPELEAACELVFREHKITSGPITWSKDKFQGRLPFGLSAMAKEILVSKNVIYFPKPGKKMVTQLNPLASAATNFEEASEFVQRTKPSLVTTTIMDEQVVHTINQVSRTNEHNNYLRVRITGRPESEIAETKWYMQSLFCYAVWPACAAFAGALIAWLMGFLFTKLFF